MLRKEGNKLASDVKDNSNTSVFKLDGIQNSETEKHFYSSAYKILPFYESAAFDEKGNLLINEKRRALHKLGHSLHD